MSLAAVKFARHSPLREFGVPYASRGEPDKIGLNPFSISWATAKKTHL
ncbi:MAG TPA: hypothetical protein VNH83_11685 [Bryobacteraceae bacterium]|jgi:hypothetical protein|nr:hypothetical protein [Bryobacteraceae bacterium]